jgi:Putative transposase
MLTIAADPKHLGDRIGITSVLHTWGSALTHHPHVHMIVSGGGISLLGAFDDTARNAMKSIAHVRNMFAHHLDVSFSSANRDFQRAMRRLTLHERRSHYPHHLYGSDSKYKIEPIKSDRDKFLVNLKLALLVLMRDRCSHEMYTNNAFAEDQLHEKFQQMREAEELRD